MAVVGFDLGNKSSVVAVAQRGGIDVLMNEVSSRQTPYVIAAERSSRFFLLGFFASAAPIPG